MKNFRLGAIAAAAALTALAGQANAAVLNFNLESGGTNVGSGDGNVRTFTNGGVTLTATAWSYETGGSTYTMESAYLGQYSGNGLGVDYGGDDDHYVDNEDQVDFIYLSFSEAVNLTSAYFTVFDINYGSNNTDGDAASYYRTSGSAAPTNGGNWLTFDNNWSSAIAMNGSSTGSRNTGSSAYSTGWIISAAPGSQNDEDAFKLKSLSVNTQNAVPEPATWAMMIGGFGAVGSMLRRRKMVVA